METSKDYYIAKYKELKSLKKKKPLRKEFLDFCKIQRVALDKVFGKDPYSKLQKAAGDDPNKLDLERTPLLEILTKYGELVRNHQRKIVAADWLEANYTPTPDGIRVVHKIQWTQLPKVFADNFNESEEWKDVITILDVPNSLKSSGQKSGKSFNEIVHKIVLSNPDRKRIIEEGYKIEIRAYLEKFFDVEEEVGETNPDLLLNKKYPIEIKKDPTQSEYDRLLGQMIRHNKSFGSAIAVITSVSSQDRYKKFQRLFLEVHNKMGMTAELILK